MLCGAENGLLKIGVLEKSHARFPSACHRLACASPDSNPKSKRENGFKEARSDSRAEVFFPSSAPVAPSIARTRGGSDGATFRRRSNRPGLDSRNKILCTVSSGESS